LPIPITISNNIQGTKDIGYEISYVYRSSVSAISRRGKIYINADLTWSNIQLVDEYEYTGTSTEELKLDFTAQLLDANSDTYKDCIGIYYTNTSAGDSGTFIYSYKSIS
jgi:hypothetical protein